MKLSPKQMRLLQSMTRKPVIAPWSTLDLTILEQLKLVSGEIAFGANGKVHTSKVWTITDGGRLIAEGQKA